MDEVPRKRQRDRRLFFFAGAPIATLAAVGAFAAAGASAASGASGDDPGTLLAVASAALIVALLLAGEGMTNPMGGVDARPAR
ncbi:hypothetical protein ACIQMJ_00675 [Actinosynnema sp. NPDC091369]